MPTFLRFIVGVLVALSLLTAPPAAAAATEPAPVTYDPPVDAPITDPFRAPVSRYAAGNRGVDYATSAGDPVRAAADGVVTFAGRVGHGLHLVIAHDDGVRTSYSFLEALAARRGDRVARGDVIGSAAASMHFGARIGDAYVDPRDLFTNTGVRAHLVDDDDEYSGTALVDDRRSLVGYLRGLAPRPNARDIDDWERAQRGCTPERDDATTRTSPTPSATAPPHRRIALLVGGLGSSTGSAAILDVDTEALGYAPDDVHQFTYRTDGQPYGPADTQQDIEVSARNLADTVDRIAAANPEATIDVLAHSQGGLVVRSAMAQRPDAFDAVATVVTLGTPHRGNTLAAAGKALTYGVRLAGIDPHSISVGQLATGSDFITELGTAPPPPPHIEVRSIAASTDAIVPAGAARWPAQPHVTIDLDGPPTPTDHARLPGDPAVTREIQLALQRQPAGCTTYGDWRTRHLDGALVGAAQAHLATAVTWAAERAPAGGRVVVRR